MDPRVGVISILTRLDRQGIGGLENLYFLWTSFICTHLLPPSALAPQHTPKVESSIPGAVMATVSHEGVYIITH